MGVDFLPLVSKTTFSLMIGLRLIVYKAKFYSLNGMEKKIAKNNFFMYNKKRFHVP